MTSLHQLSAAELLSEYRASNVTPSETTADCLKRIGALDAQLNAVTTLTSERAIEAAAQSDRRWRTGTARALEGIPFVLKDVVCTAGVLTTGGSDLLRQWTPDYSAAVTERMEAAGAVLLAKVQTMEFAFGGVTSGPWGVVRNPWDTERTAGTSSSGPACALAAGYAPLAIGTDTAGSVREPASFCNLTALKPTYGRIPRHGVFPLSWSLDHVGPMARTALDTALLLQVIAGWDERDPTASRADVPDYLGQVSRGLDRIRIGVPEEWFWDVVEPEVAEQARRILDLLADLGATIVPVSLPNVALSDGITWTVMMAEFGSVHEDTLRELPRYDAGNQQVLPAAQFISASDYLRALRLRAIVQQDFTAAFDSVDVLVVPSAIGVAPLIGNLGTDIAGRFYDYVEHFGRTFVPFNVTGLPALSLPSGRGRHGLPVGVQLAGRPFDEGTLLAIGALIQTVDAAHLAQPNLGSQAS